MRGWTSCSLVALLCLSWGAAAATANKAMPAAAAKDQSAMAKATPALAGDEAAGFSIGRVPAWVQPVAVEAGLPLPASPVQVLLFDRQTRVDPAGTAYFMHSVRQVNDAAGLQKGAQIEIEFDPSYQKLVLHQVSLWRDGRRIDKLDRRSVKLLHRETQLERQKVDGRMTASLNLDDLRVGDRIEWSASLVGDNPVFNGRFVDIDWIQSELGPTAVWQLRLLVPAARTVRHRVADAEVEVRRNEVREGWRETVFRRRGAAQFRYDDQLPASEYLRHQIEFSEFADWAEVANWSEQLFAKAMRPSPALQARIAEIQAQAATPADRLRLALDFVQKDIRYFGTEIGAGSHQPAAAETVLRQRFGDCKDKAALLASLANGLGLQATPVLVSANYRSAVQSRLPSPLAFDHAIASVVLDGQTLWLDATRSQQSGAPSTRQSVGLGHGLPARKGVSALTALPPTRDVLRSETVDTFSFPKLSQEGTLESVTTYHGDAAEWLRDAQANLPAADFEKMLVAEIGRAYPNFVRTAAPQVVSEAQRNAVTVTLRYRTDKGYWRFPDQRSLMGDFALVALMSPLRLPDQTPRTQPLRINAPGRYRHSIRFQFGEPVFSQPASAKFDEVNQHFELHVRYDSQRQVQSVDAELSQLGDVIEPADWAAYRDKLVKVFPRLAGSVYVPALSPQQAEALRVELAALTDSLRRGDVKVVTRQQAMAHARLAMLTRQLSSNRLPEAARAQALTEQGVQLDHLGRLPQAQAAFQDALALDSSNADARAALAVNALLRRQDAEAVDHATQALQMAPGQVGARYTRAWARYFAGDMAQARDELQEILQSRSEVERSYGAIWLHLVTRRLGGDGVAATEHLMPTGDQPGWPHPVLQWLNGKLDFKAALAATRDEGQPDPGRECELYFYAGQKALIDADLATARSLLKKSVGTGVVEFNEYVLAQRELDRIGAR